MDIQLADLSRDVILGLNMASVGFAILCLYKMRVLKPYRPWYKRRTSQHSVGFTISHALASTYVCISTYESLGVQLTYRSYIALFYSVALNMAFFALNRSLEEEKAHVGLKSFNRRNINNE